MSSIRDTLVLVTLLVVGVGGVGGVAAVSVSAAGQNDTAEQALVGSWPAAAWGSQPGVVWHDEAGAMPRVMAAVPPGTPPVLLGPPGEGADDPPVAAAGARGGPVWVATARLTRDASTLWVQRWEGRWQPAEAAPRATTWDAMPSLAVGGAGELWIVWRGSEPGGTARLYAASRQGGTWSRPEMLPMATTEPGAPFVAVDAAGRPTVVWTASDGSDPEVWMSRRAGGRWNVPVQLSFNTVPDTLPAVASVRDEVLVTWSSYTPDGYVAVARRVAADGRPGSIRRLSEGQGIAPFLLTDPSDSSPPMALWTRRRGVEQLLEGAFYEAGGWSEPAVLGSLPGSALSAAAGEDGQLLLAWAEAGRLGITEGRVGRDTSGRPSLERDGRPGGDAVVEDAATPVAAQEQPTLPRRYLAFGDSQTEGVIKFPNKIIISPGYPPLLDGMIDGLIGTASVPNRGIGGEITAEGLDRIVDEIEAHDPDAILIMEGTNDVTRKLDPETIAFNLRGMVERSQEQGVLTFLSLLMPRGEFGFAGPWNDRTRDVNRRIETIIEDTGAVRVDMFNAFLGKSELYSNPTHPNEEGYERMAEVWFDHLKPEIIARTNRGDTDDSGRVDGLDLVRMALAFGSRRGEPRYRLFADVNQDGIVDGFDLSILADFFGQTLDDGGS